MLSLFLFIITTSLSDTGSFGDPFSMLYALTHSTILRISDEFNFLNAPYSICDITLHNFWDTSTLLSIEDEQLSSAQHRRDADSSCKDSHTLLSSYQERHGRETAVESLCIICHDHLACGRTMKEIISALKNKNLTQVSCFRPSLLFFMRDVLVARSVNILQWNKLRSNMSLTKLRNIYYILIWVRWYDILFLSISSFLSYIP